jgi:hypothetical protein
MLINGIGGTIVECFSNANVMLGSMPNAQIKPFCLSATRGNDTLAAAVIRDFLNQLRAQDHSHHQQQQAQDDLPSSSTWWKVIIVYATENASSDDVEHFIESLQRQYPRAVMVGGICSMALCQCPEGWCHPPRLAITIVARAHAMA